jgi:lysophospholipase L1-like esterase
MEVSMIRRPSSMRLVGLSLLACTLPVLAQTQPAATAPTKFRIVLAGDSTVATGNGWGPGFAKQLADDTESLDLAANGRSSKSFLLEGLWKKCLAAKPDIVLIQFGHNDQPGKGADRETDPKTTYIDYMSIYIDEARAIGAKPILVTSLARRQWGDDGKIHSTLTPWVDAVIELGKSKNVPVVDLHAASIVLYEKLGKDAVDQLSAKTATGGIDNTHLNAQGSDVIGQLVADELKKTVPDLAPHLKL